MRFEKLGQFITAGTLTGRHFCTNQSKIDSELSPVLIPMVQQDAADHRHSRDGENFLVTRLHLPRGMHSFVAESRQQPSDVGDALFENLQDFFGTRRTGVRAAEIGRGNFVVPAT